MPPFAEISNANNPYLSPACWQDEPLMDASSEAENTALRAFVGFNAGYYLQKWAPRLRNPSGEVGMNWVAFFLPTFWFAYRKMYRTALIIYAVGLAHVVITDIVFLGILGTKRAPFAIGRIVIGIVCGLSANVWYLSRARGAISTARAQGFQDDQLLHVLSARGGVNFFAPLGMAFLFLVWLVIAASIVNLVRSGW